MLNYVKLKPNQHKTIILIYAHTLIKHITNRSRYVKSRWGNTLNISSFIANDSNFTNASCLVVRPFYWVMFFSFIKGYLKTVRKCTRNMFFKCLNVVAKPL